MIEVVKPSWSWLLGTEAKMEFMPLHTEECGRTCYRSEDKITEDSCDKFVEMLCRNGHESVLEHEVLTARIVCSRAASHQLVRHRLGAYSQESMRYCNYGKQNALQVICPPSIGIPAGMSNSLEHLKSLNARRCHWINTITGAYREYLRELKDGIRPEDARFVLPNATKTEVVVTYNLRMWRHVIRERGLNKKAQWEIRGIFSDIYDDLKLRLPAVFGDLET